MIDADLWTLLVVAVTGGAAGGLLFWLVLKALAADR